VLAPHPFFRLFATANTVGLGNLNGLYHGAQKLNHAQIDRWNIVATLTTSAPTRRWPSSRRACRRWPTRLTARCCVRWWRWPT